MDKSLTFTCKTSDQCVSNGQTGVCEISGGCSFVDTSCVSGRRYGHYAGLDLGDQCTECGNAKVDPGEECDDGDRATDDACLPTCRWNVCGDGFPRARVEECDDGNTTNGDECSTVCLRCTTGDARFVWPDNGHCYTRHNQPRTWVEAQRVCAETGAHLLTHNSVAEQTEIRRAVIDNSTATYWIGLRDVPSVGYSWITGEPVISTFFSAPGPGLCAANKAATGGWMFLDCSSSNGFICEDRGWAIDGDQHHAYRAFFDQPSWTQARDACVSWGSHLLTINNPKEQTFISVEFFGTFWLGAMKMPGGQTLPFTWVTGEPFGMTYFAAGEPDLDQQSCLALGNDRLWHDRPCDGSLLPPYGYICEVE